MKVYSFFVYKNGIELYLCLEPLLEILVSSSVYYQFDELSGGVCHLTDNSKDFGA